MITTSLLMALVATAIPSVAARPDPDLYRRAMSKFNEVRTCGLSDEAPTVKAPKANPWAQITPDDVTAVWDLLHSPAAGLNLTHPDNATATDNYIYFIDTLATNKSAVLPYIDGNGALPPKYARAVIFEGGKTEPVSQDYMIGPLPVSEKTTIEKLDYIYNGGNGGTVPYNSRYFDGKRTKLANDFLLPIVEEINDILVALFDGAWYGSGDPRTNLTITSTDPQSFDGSSSFRSMMFRYPGKASYLTPLDFYILLDVSGTDISYYKLKGFVTNEKYFKTVAELRKAFEAGEIKNEFPQTRDQEWALVNHKPEMGVRDLEDRMAPQNIEIGGKRYKLDIEEGYVEYMGWTFYLSFTRSLGLAFNDVKFKGERVLYELQMQEAAAQYAGYTPKAANTVYHDTYYSFGTTVSALVEGYDCPFGSTMLNVTYPAGGKTRVHPGALCIFEADTGFPLARHSYGTGSEYGFGNLASVKDSALHLRLVYTVGNYDYLFDYSFHVDGSMEIQVRASGYLQSSPYYKTQGRFGPRIYQSTQGSYHSHILNFKADFDILDTKNSLEVTELIVANQTQPWFPELGVFEQMELSQSYMQEEKMFNWAANNQAMYSVVNKAKTNAWGEKRGYRIVPGRSNVALPVKNSPFSAKSSTMLKSHLAVTRQHDNEPVGNSFQNVNMAAKPQQDFAKFFDGENVDDEDIVLWFNLGMHHYTRSEDVPVTLFSEAVSSIVLAPQNFNDRAPEGDLRNRRWGEVDADGVLTYEDYSIELPTCQIKLEEPFTKIEKLSFA
ncbi:putative copper amine oxidase [Rhypophila sp. PSN 637]